MYLIAVRSFESMPPVQQEDSLFNMGLAYLKRIDKLLTLCQHSAFMGDMDAWTKNLRGVYREASVKLDDDEKKELEGDPREKIEIVKLLDAFIEKGEANFRNIYFLLNHPTYNKTHKRTIMFLIDALEMNLRGKLQKKQMLLPGKADPRMSITQR